ncbi:MAG TPA: hypothetical protein VII12_18715 [Thermoanaerobaculia bacterium]
MSRDWKIAVSAIGVLCVASGITMLAHHAQPRAVPSEPHKAITVAAALIELPPSEPSSAVPTLTEAATARVDKRAKALAAELARMWTSDPEELVDVIDQASRRATVSPSVTLLLAIAHAETSGQILDISEAGAVGLAQATPIACLQERCQGKLFVTTDYVIGAGAYIMKKPLGDADTIASLILAHDDAKTRRRAKRLLDSAFSLRLEGVDELDLLQPFAPKEFSGAISAAKRHNLKRLRELRVLLRDDDKTAMRTYRDHVRKEYRDLKRTQIDHWSRYQHELMDRRDAMLERHFGLPSWDVKKHMAYQAGEYLAAKLDERFSPTKMAAFLVRHLENKAEEARMLATRDREVEEMTAALYNGGSHNVKRMLAGLIVSLPETENYRKKVPATRRRLDHSIARLETPSASKRRLEAR